MISSHPRHISRHFGYDHKPYLLVRMEGYDWLVYKLCDVTAVLRFAKHLTEDGLSSGGVP